MNAKQFVLMHYPDARAKRLTKHWVEHSMYEVIRDVDGIQRHISTGNSESNAWVNAKKAVLEKLKKEKENGG